LVVQHLHADFAQGLLDWMSRASALPVSIAEHGELARAGRVYFAASGRHLRLSPGGRLDLDPAPPSVHCPSADQLFQSVADHAGSAGVGVIMTGMGDDGARGLLAMHLEGAHTLGQDESTCAVFGMPRAARKIGAITTLLPTDQLARAVLGAVAEVLA
jgi:two-component system chemotaxis response regulator CheB